MAKVILAPPLPLTLPAVVATATVATGLTFANWIVYHNNNASFVSNFFSLIRYVVAIVAKQERRATHREILFILSCENEDND